MPQSTRTKPVSAGKEYSVEITGLGHAGEGVARVENFAVFVPGAIPGDTARIEINEVKKNYARGKLVAVEKPSEARVAPQCGVHGDCGGCQLQMIDYDEQLRLKQQRVMEAIGRIGGIEQVPIKSVLGMKTPYRYRNKSQYPVTRRDGRVILGFYKQGTHDVVEAPSGCLIDHPLNTKAVRAVGTLLNQLDLSVYDEATGKGLLRHVVARASASLGEVMVVFVTNGPELPHQNELIGGLTELVPEVVSVAQNINTAKGNIIFGPVTKTLWGKPVIEDAIGPLKFEISPRSFFQVNPVQTEVLYDVAKEYAGLTGTELVVDGYCGIGTIALYVADRAKQVIGIEDVPEAIHDARRNAERNGIENVEFFTDQVERRLPALVSDGLRPDVVILDPPRKGSEPEVLAAIARAGVSRVVYVSCNPSSLARDLAVLHGLGYETQMVQPVDMFPHTSHVEAVALIVRK